MLAQQTLSADVVGLLQVFVEQHDIDATDLAPLFSSAKERNSITYQQWWDALAELRRLSNIEHLGLALGKCIAPEFSGVLGFLGMTSMTLGDALAHFERFQPLLYGGKNANIERHSNTIRCEWLSKTINKDSDETLVASLVTFARLLANNESLSPTKIGFMHDGPRDLATYEDFFRCDIEFGCPTLYVEASSSFECIPLAAGNSSLGSILEQQAQAMLDVLPVSKNALLEQVSQSIVESLKDEESPQESVANKLGVSSRTLHRKLTQCGVHFSDLLQEIRFNLAKQHLKKGELSMAEIAHQLGYSEQSAFTRAFKKWSGETPITYAKDKRQR